MKHLLEEAKLIWNKHPSKDAKCFAKSVLYFAAKFNRLRNAVGVYLATFDVSSGCVDHNAVMAELVAAYKDLE